MSEKIQAVKGMRDLLPPETARWQRIERACASVLERWGYAELRTPIAEYTPLFLRSIGEVTDIVEKEMYTFDDRDGRSLTLRPEGTAGAVRALCEHDVGARDPVTRWYYLGPMFRHERPQRGRYRQFHQVGAEVFGVAAPAVDAEMIGMIAHMLEACGLADPTVRMSSLGCENCRPVFRERLTVFLAARADRLCEDCRRRLAKNPLRVLDCKVPGCVEARAGHPTTLDALCADCAAHFAEVRESVSALGVAAEVDASLVRGLDYYTRTTFEVSARSGDLGSQNTLVGGGRYDRLVEELGGAATPAIGFAMGLERVVLALGGEETPGRPDAFLAALGPAARRFVLATAHALRKAGLSVETDPRGGSFKSQMRRADKLGAPLVVLVGDNEIARGAVTLKAMATGEQREVATSDLEAVIRAGR